MNKVILEIFFFPQKSPNVDSFSVAVKESFDGIVPEAPPHFLNGSAEAAAKLLCWREVKASQLKSVWLMC